jgi:group I intron endonuclease
MNGKGYIYLITNEINHKGYVGKTNLTVAKRWKTHLYHAKRGSMQAIHCAIREYGLDNFSVREICRCDELLLNDLEKHYIEFFGTLAHVGHGYNLTVGGDGGKGRVTSEETKKKLSASKKGQIPWCAGTKGVLKANSGSFKKGHTSLLGSGFKKGNQLGRNMKGYKHSKEALQKMRDNRPKKWSVARRAVYEFNKVSVVGNPLN